MIYNYLGNIDNQHIFKYLALGIGIILLIQRINPTKNFVIGIVVAIVLAYYLNDRESNHGSNFIIKINNALKGPLFKGTNYYFVDSELVELLLDIKEYHEYNPSVYRKIILIIDRFLNIVNDMEKNTSRMGNLYQIAEQQKYKAINALHSMIHTVPQTDTTVEKHKHALKKMEILLNTHLDNIYNYMVYSYGKDEINTSTKFIYKNHPKGHNYGINNNYDFY